MVASRRRRFAAGVIDAGVVLIGLGLAGVGAFKLYRRDRDREQRTGTHGDLGTSDRSSGTELPERVSHGLAKVAEGTTGGRALVVAGLLTAISARNVRSVGYRLVGIRRVDARHGGAVTVQSAVIRHLSKRSRSWLTRRLSAPRQKQLSQRIADLSPQIAEIERHYPKDPVARQNAIMALYEREHVNPLSPVIWLLAAALVWPLSSLLTRSRQSIDDRLSRTVFVRDR